MLQYVLVSLIVVAAALSAAWRLMGIPTRIRLLEALARALGQPDALRRMVGRQRAAQTLGGCGSCARDKSR
jgi:hypothetical protein